MKLIAPSLLAFDKTKTRKQLVTCAEMGVKMIHYDVMDGKYVPNNAFEGEHISWIKQHGMLVFVHLMTKNIIAKVNEYLTYPIDCIALHPDCDDPDDVLYALETIAKSQKVIPGLAIKVDQDLTNLMPLLTKVNYVVVMGVDPGFGGQKYLPETTDLLKALHKLIQTKKLPIKVVLDGGVTDEIINETKAYVDVFVTGSFLMHSPDYPAMYQKLVQLANQEE